MVQLVDSGRSISRYRMLETIRIFAQERAFDAGATSDLRDRHRAHFVALAQREDWLLWPCHARVHDQENFRAAGLWAEATGRSRDLGRLGAIMAEGMLGRGEADLGLA